MKNLRWMICILTACLLLAGHGYAAERNWIADTAGDFNATTSWQDGEIPAPADTGIFGIGGDASYGVTFSEATTSVAGIHLKDGDTVAFDLSEKTLNVTASYGLTIGHTTGDAAATFTNGTLTANNAMAARASNQEASLTFGAGANATLGTLVIGSGATGVENTKGTVRVEGGADVTMANSVIRPRQGADLIVTGNDTVLNVTSGTNRRWYVYAGAADGQCNMTISNGALLHAAGALDIRAENTAGSGGHPVITVDNATMRTEGSLKIGEFNSTTLTLKNNALFRSNASLLAGWTQTNTDVQHAVNVNVESGSTLSVADSISTLGNRNTVGMSTIAITVTGNNSLIKSEGGLYVGGTAASLDQAPATLSVLDGGKVEVQNLLRINRENTTGVGASRLELGRGTITAGELEFRSATTRETSRFDVTLFDAQAGLTLVDVRKNVIGEDEDENPIYSSGNATLGVTGGAFLSVQLDGAYSYSGEDVFTLLRVEGTRDGLFVDALGVFIQNDDIVWEGTGGQEGWFARINYIDGDGGDPSFVTLTVIPEPGSGALVLLASAMGLRLWRRRRGY